MNATLTAGWACLALGVILTFVDFVFFNAPFYVAAFVLGIVAAGQKQGRMAVLLIAASVIVPAVAFSAMMGR
jgi:hypothetical protein